MNFHDFFKNNGFRMVFRNKSKILYISAAKWGCPIASYLPIARLGAAIRITDCIVPDWFPDSIYWPALDFAQHWSYLDLYGSFVWAQRQLLECPRIQR